MDAVDDTAADAVCSGDTGWEHVQSAEALHMEVDRMEVDRMEADRMEADRMVVDRMVVERMVVDHMVVGRMVVDQNWTPDRGSPGHCTAMRQYWTWTASRL